MLGGGRRRSLRAWAALGAVCACTGLTACGNEDEPEQRAAAPGIETSTAPSRAKESGGEPLGLPTLEDVQSLPGYEQAVVNVEYSTGDDFSVGGCPRRRFVPVEDKAYAAYNLTSEARWSGLSITVSTFASEAAAESAAEARSNSQAPCDIGDDDKFERVELPRLMEHAQHADARSLGNLQLRGWGQMRPDEGIARGRRKRGRENVDRSDQRRDAMIDAGIIDIEDARAIDFHEHDGIVPQPRRLIAGQSHPRTDIVGAAETHRVHVGEAHRMKLARQALIRKIRTVNRRPAIEPGQTGLVKMVGMLVRNPDRIWAERCGGDPRLRIRHPGPQKGGAGEPRIGQQGEAGVTNFQTGVPDKSDAQIRGEHRLASARRVDRRRGNGR